MRCADATILLDAARYAGVYGPMYQHEHPGFSLMRQGVDKGTRPREQTPSRDGGRCDPAPDTHTCSTRDSRKPGPDARCEHLSGEAMSPRTPRTVAAGFALRFVSILFKLCTGLKVASRKNVTKFTELSCMRYVPRASSMVIAFVAALGPDKFPLHSAALAEPKPTAASTPRIFDQSAVVIATNRACFFSAKWS
jgi:hypothetical protein